MASARPWQFISVSHKQHTRVDGTNEASNQAQRTEMRCVNPLISIIQVGAFLDVAGGKQEVFSGKF